MSFADLLPEASAFLALASTGGLGLQWGRVTNLRATRDDQEKEIVRLHTKVDQLESSQREDKATIAQQASDIDAIRRTVTGEVQWQVISDDIDHHHAEAKMHWDEQRDLLTQILETLVRRGGPL